MDQRPDPEIQGRIPYFAPTGPGEIRYPSLNYAGAVDIGWTRRSSWTQAWSRMVFLTEEHPQRFARWIRSMRTGNRHWQEAMYAAFGWTDEEFDRSWKAWTREKLGAGKAEMR